MSLSEEEGPHEFVSFLLDMNRLFERFVGRMFIRELDVAFANVELQSQWALGRKRRSDGTIRPWGRIRPDIELRRLGQPICVLDTKYKPTSAEQVQNPDVYQVLAYCTARKVSYGGLIYPRSEFKEEDEIAVQYSPIRIRRFPIDLNVPSEQLLPEGMDLVKRVRNWIAAGGMATQGAVA